MIPTKYIIPSFLPNFMKEDYPLFKEFLEAYFEFVESEGIDLQSVRDPWNSTDSFLDKLLKDLLPEVSSIPLTTEGKRILASKIIELRKAKGSAASYELFFKLFYGSSVDVEIPYEDVLIPSAARWVQNYSMLVRSVFSTDVISELRGKHAFATSQSKTSTINISDVFRIDDDLYEVFFDRSFIGEINVGDNLISQTFTSRFEILSSLSSLKILEGGLNFRGGIFVTVPNDNGNPATLKIIKSGTGGKALSVTFRDQGFAYDTAGGFIIYIAPPPNSSIISVPAFYSEVDAVEWYKQFRPDLSDEAISTLICSIQVSVGSFCKRAGFYEGNKNILSDVAILQGGSFYQKYSYVTKVQKRLEKYKTLLKTMIHPAGFALFGSFDVYQQGSIRLSWKNFIQRTYVQIFEDYGNVASFITKHVFKGIQEEQSVTTQVTKSAIKPLVEVANTSSAYGLIPNKVKINAANTSAQYSLNPNKIVTNIASSQTSRVKDFGKSQERVAAASSSIASNFSKVGGEAVNTSASAKLRLLGLYVDVDYIQGGSFLYVTGIEKTPASTGLLDHAGKLYDESELTSSTELFT